MQNMKKSNETILSNNIQKSLFFPTARPLLALFWIKRAFFQKSDNNIFNVLGYSIFMQKNIKKG
jgi:hypothetical protein